MARLLLHVEGQAEETFVNEILRSSYVRIHPGQRSVAG